MGLLFYYLFHYLFFSFSSSPPSPPPPFFLPGLKVNINQRQHLCCVPLFILQSYAAALLSAEAHLQCSADTCGLFVEVLAVVLCHTPAVQSCGPEDDRTQWIFHTEPPRCWDHSWYGSVC